MVKTNAMRLLSSAKIPFETIEYEVDENNLAGGHVAEQIGMPKEQVFKTLVAKGEKKGIYVFCIPVDSELSLKKAAKLVCEKKIEMLHVKDLLATTGYIRGGCSPVGMKKKFPTFINETALQYDKISVSAGVKGCQMIVNPNQLAKFVGATLADVVME